MPTRSISSARQKAFDCKSSLLYQGSNVAATLVPTDTTILQIGAVTDYTFGARVMLLPKTTANNNDDQCLVNFDLNYGAFEGYGFYVDAVNGTPKFLAGQTFYNAAANSVKYGIWQSVIMRLTGTTLDIFVQGQKIFTTTVTRVATGGSGVNLGTEGTGTGAVRRLFGNAREFFAVKSALSDAQIAAIAQSAIYPSGLGFLYICDDQSGTTVADTSGNNNTGTLTTLTFSTVVPSQKRAAAVAFTRQNLITSPSFESAIYWTFGSAGTVTGITFNLQDTTHVLFGSKAAHFQGQFNNNTFANTGQYYLTIANPITPTPGRVYTFSINVYIPVGSPITKITMGIRDYNTYDYISNGGNPTVAPVVAGQWNRISCQAVAVAGSSWRVSVSDPNTDTNFTGIVDFWVDATLLEESDKLLPYFDGDNGGSWTGTPHQSISQQIATRFSAAGRAAV